MAGKRALKVYRTSIGFHDAYVAAPSQKAALKAWGSEKDLFARGVAEIVTDAKLAKEALAQPGVVVRKLRGTAAEQLAALPKTKRSAARPRDAPDKEQRPKARTPPLSRAGLDRAEQALEELIRRYDEQIRQLDARLQKLAQQKSLLLSRRDAKVAKLESKRDREREIYQEGNRADR